MFEHQMSSRYERWLQLQRMEAWCVRQTGWRLVLVSIGLSAAIVALIMLVAWLLWPPPL